MEKSNEERIKEGQGWIPIGKSEDGEYKVEMLREKINIWVAPPKDQILRIIKIEPDEQIQEQNKIQ